MTDALALFIFAALFIPSCATGLQLKIKCKSVPPDELTCFVVNER